MTAQEIFETVARHLFAQGHRAVAQGMSADCRYRLSDGRRCAVGCLISDEDYRPEMEGNDVWQIALPASLREHVELLGELQGVHDHARHWRNTAEMRTALRTTARECGLDGSCLDTLHFEDR